MMTIIKIQQYRCNFSLLIFINVLLVESEHVEPTDREGWHYKVSLGVSRSNLKDEVLCQRIVLPDVLKHEHPCSCAHPNTHTWFSNDQVFRVPDLILFRGDSRHLALFKGHVRRIIISLIASGLELSHKSGQEEISQGILLWIVYTSDFSEKPRKSEK